MILYLPIIDCLINILSLEMTLIKVFLFPPFLSRIDYLQTNVAL